MVIRRVQSRAGRAAIAAVALLVLGACSTAADRADPRGVDEPRAAATTGASVSTTAALSDVPPTTQLLTSPPTAAPPPATSPAVLTGGFTGVEGEAYENSATFCSLYTVEELASDYGLAGVSADTAALAYAKDTYRPEFWSAAQAGCMSTLG